MCLGSPSVSKLSWLPKLYGRTHCDESAHPALAGNASAGTRDCSWASSGPMARVTQSRFWSGSPALCTGQASALIGHPATGHDVPELRGHFLRQLCDDLDTSLTTMQCGRSSDSPFYVYNSTFVVNFLSAVTYHYPILEHCHHPRKMADVYLKLISIHMLCVCPSPPSTPCPCFIYQYTLNRAVPTCFLVRGIACTISYTVEFRL